MKIGGKSIPTGLLRLPRTYKPSRVDIYEYSLPPANPSPPPVTNSPPPESLPTKNPLNSSNNNDNSNCNNLLVSKEIEKWNLLWKTLVDNLIQITDFPPILVRTPEEQRESLLILTQNVCQIASNPTEFKEYKDLLEENHRKDKTIDELNAKNLELQNEIDQIKNDQKDEIKQMAHKIEQLENYALQIEHYTIQVDKRKDAAQLTTRNPSQRASLLPTDAKDIHNAMAAIGNRSSSSTVKLNNKAHNEKKLKLKAKKVTKEKDNQNKQKTENEPQKAFKFEENQRFQEDYVAKLIQKYTKGGDKLNQQDAVTNKPIAETPKSPTLYERSLKPSEEITPKAPPNYRKRQAFKV